MRIMLVVTAEATAANFLVGFVNYLTDQGNEVAVVANAVDCLPGAGIKSANLISVAMSRNPDPRRDPLSLARLLGAIRAYRPEILVYATPKASFLAAIAGRLIGVPVRIYNLWGLRLETASGLMYRVLWLFEKIVISVSTAVVANSLSLAGRAEEVGLARPGRIRVLGKGSSHGVDVRRFAPGVDTGGVDPRTQEYLDRTKGLTVGFVGRLHPDKGVDTVLQAVRICAGRGLRLRLLLIGSDDGLMCTGLPGCAELVRDGLVHVVGGVPDPRAYYATMDVLVLMSKREGFPNVVLEAAAMGVPAVVSDATGVVDSVVDGETGVIVGLGRADRLADELAALADDPARVLTLGRQARQRVEEHFAQEAVWAANEKAISAHWRRYRGMASTPRSR